MKIRTEVKKEFPKDKMLAELHEVRLRLLEKKKIKISLNHKKNQQATFIPS